MIKKECRKILFSGILSLMLGIPSFTYALDYGIKGGLTYTTAVEANDASGTTRLLTLGTILTQPIIENIDLQLEINFAQKGYKSKSLNELVAMDYLEIPLLVKYTTSNNLSLYGGGYFGSLLKAKAGATDLSNQLKSNDYGISAGAALSLSKNYSLDLRYTYGLAELANNSTAKNAVVSFSLNYMF